MSTESTTGRSGRGGFRSAAGHHRAGRVGCRGCVLRAAPGRRWQRLPGSGTEATVQVLPGDSARDIGQALEAADVVKSADAFVEAASAEEASRGLQPGFYLLKQQMSAKVSLELMLDPSSRAAAGHLARRAPAPRRSRPSPLVRRFRWRSSRRRRRMAPRSGCRRTRTTTRRVSSSRLATTSSPTTPRRRCCPCWLRASASHRVRSTWKAGPRCRPQPIPSARRREPARSRRVSRGLHEDRAGGPLQPAGQRMPLQFDSTVNYAPNRDTVAVSLADLEVESPTTPTSTPGCRPRQSALR